MFVKAFIAAQTRVDIRKYGLIGFRRDDEFIKRVDQNHSLRENCISLEKAILVNIEKTATVPFLPGLTRVCISSFLPVLVPVCFRAPRAKSELHVLISTLLLPI